MNAAVSMFRGLRTALVLLIVAALTACSSIRTGSHLDETNNFSAYSTFSWIADDPYIRSDTDLVISPLTQAKIQGAIRDQLEFKGYRYTGDRDEADFVVSYTVGSRETIRTTSYPVAYHGTWGWHVRGSDYYIREYEEHSYTEGTLAVDVFDGASKKPVWHGWAEKTITMSDRRNPDAVINDSVIKLLESFPR
ncbi:MAG: DUF4136 domain-containing protein [Woeseia sp.]